jgi:hypothetical protein
LLGFIVLPVSAIMELVLFGFLLQTVHWHQSKTRYPFRIAQFLVVFAFAQSPLNRVRPYVGLVKAQSMLSRIEPCQKISQVLFEKQMTGFPDKNGSISLINFCRIRDRGAVDRHSDDPSNIRNMSIPSSRTWRQWPLRPLDAGFDRLKQRKH